MRQPGNLAPFTLAALLLSTLNCETPTVMNVSVYSEIGCDAGATAAIVGATSLQALGSNAVSSTSTECLRADGGEARMGSVVLLPATNQNEAIAFAVMTRPDGQPPDGCLNASEASGCIVAKRELRFLPRTELAVRVDLRLSCLGVTCPTDTTCVKGLCVSAQLNQNTCAPSCSEATLTGPSVGAIHDAGHADARQADASMDATEAEAGHLDACIAVAPSTAKSVPQGCLVTLATGQAAPDGIAVDANSVYWTQEGAQEGGATGSVMKVALGGGQPTTLVTVPNNPLNIALTKTSVYFTNGLGYVAKVPLDGGAAISLAAANGPLNIAVDTDDAYWVNLGGGQVVKVPLGGGTSVTLASANRPVGIGVDATDVYWTNAGITGPGSATVVKIPKGGGAMTTLASGQLGPEVLALDATNVYWADVSGGTIMKVAKTGGVPVTLASGQKPGGVTSDGTNVYWTNIVPNLGTIVKVAVGGGEPVTLATGQGSPNYVVVDATSAYWTNVTSGTTMKLTPK